MPAVSTVVAVTVVQVGVCAAGDLQVVVVAVEIADEGDAVGSDRDRCMSPTLPVVSTALAVTAVHAGVVQRAIFKSPVPLS
jgi:hypothetical protein